MPRIPTTYVGIDPGTSGGIAFISGDLVVAYSMPPTPADVLSLLREHLLVGHTVACLEKVWGHIGTGQPGSSMFRFGQGFGHLEMALLAIGIPSQQPVPRTWQKALGVRPKKKTETKTQWKNHLKAEAQRLFPGVKITLATCDALLLAEYCRRKYKGVA